MDSDRTDEQTLTLEAFADTIVPGEKRSSDDAAIAGASPGGGAVVGGALELLEWDAAGLSQALGDYVRDLNAHALRYADKHGLKLDPALPPFAALSFERRTDLVTVLTEPGHPEKELWVLLALFCYMAYDSAAHMATAEAIATGHPGLTSMGITAPDADGLWRYSDNSYGRPLARLHPDTIASGSLA
jgi:enediyne biosynthesis protein E8